MMSLRRSPRAPTVHSRRRDGLREDGGTGQRLRRDRRPPPPDVERGGRVVRSASRRGCRWVARGDATGPVDRVDGLLERRRVAGRDVRQRLARGGEGRRGAPGGGRGWGLWGG